VGNNLVPILLSGLALLLSAISFVWNWRHSESLFRRQEYPAVAWQLPQLSKEGGHTYVKTVVWNNGPRDIGSIYFTAFLCAGLRREAWCKSERIEQIPIGENIDFIVTRELEKDLSERFGGLVDDNGWQFEGNAKKYGVIFRLEYLPFIADVPHFVRKERYHLIPTTSGKTIEGWRIERLSRWQFWLHYFSGIN
jgi:hypothetical protein